MIQLAVIITLIIGLVLGFYTVVLLHRERKKHESLFLTSFLYYQILILLFGIYGIIGNLIIREILPKFDMAKAGIETVAQLFLFIGLPFIIAAWFLKIKMIAELCQKKTNQYIAIAYFFMVTIALLAYGLTIKNIPALNQNYHPELRKNIFLGFGLIELTIEGYIVSFLLVNAIRPKLKAKKKLLLSFASIISVVTIFKASSLYFSQLHYFIGLYFLLLYFAGNLPLVILVKVFLNKNQPAIKKEDDPNFLYNQFKITSREREIIIEICKGKTNKQIAETLFISLQTVKDHTHNIFQKTEVKNRVQLAQLFSGENNL